MKLTPSTSEPFSARATRIRQTVEMGVTNGVRLATEGFKTDLRRVVAAALGTRMGNAIGSAVYPKGQPSLGAAGTVFARGPAADKVLSAFGAGVTVRSADGFFLAIPTEAAGRRLAGQRITPGAWERAFGQRLHYVYVRGGLSMLVADGVRIGRTGRIRQSRGQRSSLRERNEVVVFWLVPQARLPKKYDADALARLWVARVPDLIDRSLPADL